MGNVSNISVKDITNLAKYTYFRTMRFVFILCLIFGIILIIPVINQSLDSLPYYIFYTLCSFLMLFIIPFSYFLSMIILKKKIKKEKLDQGFMYKYNFKTDEFEIESTSLNKQEKSVRKYGEILKIVKRDNCLYLYITKRQAFILRYDGFESENEKIKVIDLLDNLTKV